MTGITDNWSTRRLRLLVGLALTAAILLSAGLACNSGGTAVTATASTAVPSSSTTAGPQSSSTTLASDSTAPETPTTSSSATTATNPNQPPLPPLIVLDPGHSGTRLTTIDPATQIRDEEYLNTPETQNMFEVATLLAAKLREAGYRVYVTKHAWDDTISKRERVDIANRFGAALGVSIHTSGHVFGKYGEIYVQTMDSYRENIHGERVYFALPEVAALSAEYGQIFLEERRKIEGPSVRITVNTGWGERGLAAGNLPIVQLFAEVPWLLVEAGVPQNEDDKDLYAQSLFNSIVRCVPLNPLH